jgi:hypothetical protein
MPMKHVSEILPAVIPPETKPLTPIQQRLITMPGNEIPIIVFQHSVLCQTTMPYRDPGDEVRLWKRTNGRVRLELEAGRLLDPTLDEFVDVGLPFGTKPRLVLFHLNAEALRTQSPLIELEDSLTAFVQRTLGLKEGGRNIRSVKEQLNRLAAAGFRLGMSDGTRAITIHSRVITRIELWTTKDPRQRVLWPTTVEFSREYFNNLIEHAVPLNEAAVSRLAHSSMALDVYAWLAQRLHRIDHRKPALVPWVSLKEQFGEGYTRLRDFRRVFTHTLKQVQIVYREAKFSLDARGMLLRNSPPPVSRRLLQIK